MLHNFELSFSERTVSLPFMSDSYRLNLIRRPRRMRRTAALRALADETELSPRHLIQPVFVTESEGVPELIESMPGQLRFPVKELVEECRELYALGIPAVALFPKVDVSVKRDDGREALNPNALFLRAIRAIKAEVPDLAVIADLALDPYTTHGHDGLLDSKTGDLANDATVGILVEMAVLAAQAGADLVAPSDMTDGRVGAIRRTLDGNGFQETGILAYSAKFASALYGPFRHAVGSGSADISLDKRGYQLNPANRREALTEIRLDEAEGADILMVKPAGLYLDIIREVRQATDLPLAAYQVSGEYAQIMAAGRNGWLDAEQCRDESLLAIRRAGADRILTYFAKAFAKRSV